MQIYSWNINGIRAALKKGMLDFWAEHKPDILCLQEIKAMPEQVDLDVPGYHAYWNSAERKGYSGTAVFSKAEALNTILGIGDEIDDREGRVISLEFKSCYVVTCYTPNVQRTLDRLEYRHKEWDPAFLRHLKRLEKHKPVIVCGDLNVAHKEIDLAHPGPNRGNAGFTDEERGGFDRLLEAGFIDTFRQFTPDGGHYTWWSYIGRSREKNVGWRIDYFLISESLKRHLKSARILPWVMGSDHCPVAVEMDMEF